MFVYNYVSLWRDRIFPFFNEMIQIRNKREKKMCTSGIIRNSHTHTHARGVIESTENLGCLFSKWQSSVASLE